MTHAPTLYHLTRAPPKTETRNIKALAVCVCVCCFQWENAFVVRKQDRPPLAHLRQISRGCFLFLSLSGKKKNTHTCTRWVTSPIALFSLPTGRFLCAARIAAAAPFSTWQSFELSHTQIYKIASAVWTFVAFSSIWGLQPAQQIVHNEQNIMQKAHLFQL
jgi:hypothetical protein